MFLCAGVRKECVGEARKGCGGACLYHGMYLEVRVQLCELCSSLPSLCEIELELSGFVSSALHLTGPMPILKDCAHLANSCRSVFWELNGHSNNKDSKAR